MANEACKKYSGTNLLSGKALMQWPKTTIHTSQGPMPAIAPLVISASRATDIPAFHAKWFMNRLRAGYCLWENPFNTRQQQYISFEKCKVFVFWSKNPQALMPFLSEIEDRGYQYYFQYTLNDYEQEGLEPRVPKLAQRMAVFQKLSERIGKHRVIWRFDPIIMGNSFTVESVLERIQRVAERLAPHTEKLVFSFVDWYKKTERVLKKIDSLLRPPSADEMQQLAEGIVSLNQSLTTPLTLATCAETLDLHKLGIEHNRCVEPQLLLRLCPESHEIRKRYGKLPGTGSQTTLLPLAPVLPKDTGQRTPCGCAPSKDIGSYNTCMHLCEYCYANHSQRVVIDKMNVLSAKSEKL